MKQITDKTNQLFLRFTVLIGLMATATLSAGTAVQSDVPLYGSIQPGIFSQLDFSDGTALSFIPWFAAESKSGNVFGSTVSSGGITAIETPLWDAAGQLEGRKWDDRYIVTMRASTTTELTDTGRAMQPIPFTKDDITAAQYATFLIKEDEKIRFIRGDQKKEDAEFRLRPNILGDIVHANLLYVGAPNSRYSTTDYLTYVNANADRPGRVFAGANDGMLHAFDAQTGEETFAYIPSMLIPKLERLTGYDHNLLSVHNQYVDGPLGLGDAFIGGNNFISPVVEWRSILVGGLGAGGKGLFALDVSSAVTINSEDNSANGAGSKLMWEVTNTSPELANLGYTHAQATVGQMQDGTWAAVVGNGYGSSSGTASLLILDLADGSVLKEIVVTDANDASFLGVSGLSTPTVLDTNNDGKIDYAYAGDLNGFLWKFDLRDPDPAYWNSAYYEDYTDDGGVTTRYASPLYASNSSDTNLDGTAFVRQAITTAPSIAVHPKSGYLIYVGTGRLLSSADMDDKSVHQVLGIWDNKWPQIDPSSETNVVPINKSHLLEQVITEYPMDADNPDTTTYVRIVTDHDVDWTTHRGWITNLQPNNFGDNTENRKGDRILQKVSILGGRLNFVSNNPSQIDNEGENWWLQLNRYNGGAVSEIVLDANNDGSLSTDDLLLREVEGEGEDPITVEEYPIGVFIGHGIAAQPSFGVVDNQTVAALINRLFQPSYIDPLTNEPLPGNEDFGLIGGHMDLDVSSQTYVNDGVTRAETDAHSHQWDDQYGEIVDFMEIPSKHRSVDDPLTASKKNPLPALPGSDPEQLFIITVTNAHLSTGGRLLINGIETNVTDYRARTKRWLEGSLGLIAGSEGEKFPIYKLGELSSAEIAANVLEPNTYEQLTMFKMVFDRDILGTGGLIGTETGCIKRNTLTDQSEYRNGALTTQLLDASHLSVGPYVQDANTGHWLPTGGITAGPGIHTLGYAMPKGTTDTDFINHGPGDGMMWESTLFWHWDGGCYEDINTYKADFLEQVGTEFTQPFDSDISSSFFSTPPVIEEDDENQDEEDVTVVVDPNAPSALTRLPDLPDEECNQNDCLNPLQQYTPNNSDVGRLFWREYVPDQ